VRDKLLMAADSESFARIQDILVVISEDLQAKLSGPRDYAAAKISMDLLMESRQLYEAQLHEFAVAKRFEETVAALSRLSSVPVEIVDRLLADVRVDPIVILCKAVDFSWTTVRAIIGLRPSSYQWTAEDFDKAEELFNKLSVTTACRVIRFWQVRKVAGRGEPASRGPAFAITSQKAAG